MGKEEEEYHEFRPPLSFFLSSGKIFLVNGGTCPPFLSM